MPSAPQTRSLVHVPHVTVRLMPQLSVKVCWPQVLPCWAQSALLERGWQTGQVLSALHGSLLAHVPQLTVRVVPQLSTCCTLPHCALKRPQKLSSLSASHTHRLVFEQ